MRSRPPAWAVAAVALAAAVSATVWLAGVAAVGAAQRTPAASWAASSPRTSESTASAGAPWATAAPYPSSFDLRTVNKVSPVRQQQNYSTCWVQSAMASLESCLLPGAVYDFSENNLADHMASTLDYEGHGNNALSTAYFARWDGPVLESSDPYPRPDESPQGLRAVLHVQDVTFLPPRQGPLDNDALKWAVSNLGAASCAMAFVGENNDPETDSYYSSTPGLFLNHYVTCVGWDDQYPAGNFVARPPGDGAFLIKNSWGTDWGDAGYFWISYYDANFGQDMAVFNGAESPDDYDAIYQHDPLGWTKNMGSGTDTAWFAARYQCVGTGQVAAASFYTPVPGSSYEVYVAPSVADIVTAPQAAAGSIPVAGYHTVKLTTPAPVTDGSTFVVAVRLTTPGSNEPIPLEFPTTLIAPQSAPGQSYVSTDGAMWTDLTSMPRYARSDVCLKAFVDSSTGRDTLPPVVKVRRASVSFGGTAQVPYRLTDPAFSCASAAVTLSVKTAKGRTAWRTRVPAVQVDSEGVWSFPCDLPAGRYTVVAQAFDVAGNLQVKAATAALRVTPSAKGVSARH